MEIDELAKHASDFFITKRRPSERPGEEGESFVTLKPRHPKWVKGMMFKIHDEGRFFPDDYKYEYASQALDLLAEGVDPEEPQLEADVYTSDLLKWFSSHLERAGIVDEAVSELSHSPEGIIGDIMMGQAWEKEEVFRRVVEALKNRLEEIEEGIAEEFEETGRAKDPRDWSPRE